MIVISNTSPLTNLAAVNQFDLFRCLYSEIHIAEGVWQELNVNNKAWPGSKDVEDADWIHHHTVKNQLLVNTLRRDLDVGEAESIVLALELEAGLIILDEKEGRHTAQRLGLKVTGVVGMLLEAKKKGLLNIVRPHLDELRQTAGFRLDESVYDYAIELAGENKT